MREMLSFQMKQRVNINLIVFDTRVRLYVREFLNDSKNLKRKEKGSQITRALTDITKQKWTQRLK